MNNDYNDYNLPAPVLQPVLDWDLLLFRSCLRPHTAVQRQDRADAESTEQNRNQYVRDRAQTGTTTFWLLSLSTMLIHSVGAWLILADPG